MANQKKREKSNELGTEDDSSTSNREIGQNIWCNSKEPTDVTSQKASNFICTLSAPGFRNSNDNRIGWHADDGEKYVCTYVYLVVAIFPIENVL